MRPGPRRVRSWALQHLCHGYDAAAEAALRGGFERGLAVAATGAHARTTRRESALFDLGAGESRWQAGLALSEELIDGSGLGGKRVVRAGLAGVEQVVVGQAGKATLHAETGASAVDMESHIAAAYAEEAGLPFAALRVISDPATRALPAIARAAIKPNGNIDLKKVLGGLARNPLTLRALVSTGIDFNRALRSLRGCRSFLLGGESLVPADI